METINKKTKQRKVRFNEKKISLLVRYLRIQFYLLLIITAYVFNAHGLDITDKYQITISNIKTIPLILYTALLFLTLNFILEERNPIKYDVVFILILLGFISQYRGVIIEVIVLISVLVFNFRFFKLPSNLVITISLILFFLIITPMKYLMTYVNANLFLKESVDFSFSDFIKTYESGNEGGLQLSVAHLILQNKSYIYIPDGYSFTSFLQHIPFIRQFFEIERMNFNDFYQYNVFGEIDYGTASSPVAQMYLTLGYTGVVIILPVIVLAILYYRPRNIYLLAIYITALPQFLIMFNRVDYDQFFFILSICFYAWIIPFTMIAFKKNNPSKDKFLTVYD